MRKSPYKNGNSYKGKVTHYQANERLQVNYTTVTAPMSNIKERINMATVAEIVTNTIIDKLNNGIIPWFRPWDGGEAVNYVTQKPYRGINRLLLDGGEYLTFKQVQNLKGKIKKGAKSHIVVFYKQLEFQDEITDEIITKSLLRYYRVFSLEDVEGIDSKQLIKERENYSIEGCQNIVDNYLNKSGVKLKNTKTSSKAYYAPSTDSITLPKMEQFKSSEHYYATAYHEMAHSTGHKSRLNRLTKTASFGSDEYSREELIAEITSAMLCNETGIDTTEIMDNSAAYIQSWLKALKNDVNMVLVASAKAEKAFDYIIQ